MKKTIRKGDVVKYCPTGRHKYREGYYQSEDFGKTGIVLTVRKKEMTRNKIKHVMEIVVAQAADVMWSNGDIENDVPMEHIEMISRAK